MTHNETEIMIQKYLNGETTTEEEQFLALEVSREDVSDEWKIIAGMLGELTVDEALFNQIMAERRQKPRIMKLWPWVAAACVAALLIIFLGPPKDDVSTQPQTAKTAIEQVQSETQINPVDCEQTRPKDMIEPQKKLAEVKMATPQSSLSENAGKPRHDVNKPQPTNKLKQRVNVSKEIAKASQENKNEQVVNPEINVRELTKVDEDNIAPYEESQMQFAEQSRALRERGNRVIQRVSMNSTLPSINNPISNL